MRLQKLALLWMLEEKVGNSEKKRRKFGKEKSESRRKKSRKIWKRKTVAKDKRKNRKLKSHQGPEEVRKAQKLMEKSPFCRLDLVAGSVITMTTWL
jgi:ribonuclease HI